MGHLNNRRNDIQNSHSIRLYLSKQPPCLSFRECLISTPIASTRIDPPSCNPSLHSLAQAPLILRGTQVGSPKNKPRTCTHLLHSPSPPHHNRCRHHHSASRTNSHHLSLHTLKIPQIHGTNTIHQHYPPTLSTNTIHQHYPPTLSTNTIHQHYPPALSNTPINTPIQHPTKGAHAPQSTFTSKQSTSL
jgi:hypothetical protein